MALGDDLNTWQVLPCCQDILKGSCHRLRVQLSGYRNEQVYIPGPNNILERVGSQTVSYHKRKVKVVPASKPLNTVSNLGNESHLGPKQTYQTGKTFIERIESLLRRERYIDERGQQLRTLGVPWPEHVRSGSTIFKILHNEAEGGRRTQFAL